jgi:hypothetical protein
MANLPTGRVGLGVATAADGKLYAIGGRNSYGYAVATLEETTLPFGSDAYYEGHWTSPVQYRASYNFTALVPSGQYTLTVAGARGDNGFEIAPFSNVTFTVSYSDALSTTPPPAPKVSARSDGSLSTLSAHWTATDPNSSIIGYRCAIGSSPGGSDVVNWTDTSMTYVVRSGLSLQAGQKYYVSVKALNTGGLWSQPGVSNVVVAGEATPLLCLPLIQR